MSSIPQDYMQRPEETELDWKYRLLIGKANKDVKLSWEEISRLLNLQHGPEYLRKIAYGVLEYKDYIDTKKRDNSEVYYSAEMEELEDKRYEMEKEKMRMQDQKRELKKLLRESARAEHLKDELALAVSEMARVKPLLPIKVKKQKTKEGREGVLLLSDWHKGAWTNNNWNLFSDVEFRNRIIKLVDKTIEYGHENGIEVLHVFALGDLISGLIHVTTRITNTEDTIRQTQAVAEILSEILSRLSNEFPKVKVYFTRGNHDRVVANKADSVAKESFFDVIPWYVEARIKDIENVELIKNEYDDEIVVTEIAGQTIFAVHGHRDKLNNVVQNLALMIKKFPDYVFLAHYHHNAESEIHGCEIVVNPSLCGTDDYAKELRRTSKAAQKFMVFDHEEGRLCTYNIKLA